MKHAAIRELLRLGPLSPRDRLVLVAVLLYVGPNGEPCHASVAELAELAGVAPNTARRSVAQLVAGGWLERRLTQGRTAELTPTNLVAPHPSQSGGPTNLVAPPDPSQSGGPPNLVPLTSYACPRESVEEEIRPDGRKGEGPLVNGSQLKRSRSRAPARVGAPARGADIPWAEPRRLPPNAELWDTLVDVCGLDRAELKGREASKVGKAAKEIAEKGGTPALVRERAAAYRLRYPRADLTPLGLASNWTAVAPTRANGHHQASSLRAQLAALEQEPA